MRDRAVRNCSVYEVPPSRTRRRSTPAENAEPLPVITSARSEPATASVSASSSSASIAPTRPCSMRTTATSSRSSTLSIAPFWPSRRRPAAPGGPPDSVAGEAGLQVLDLGQADQVGELLEGRQTGHRRTGGALAAHRGQERPDARSRGQQ